MRVVSVALLAAAGCAGDTPRRSVEPPPNGVLSFDDRSLSFRTSFCVADGEHFAAVGSGTDRSQPFVITLNSPDRVSVRFGVRRELDQPPPDAARWRAAPSLRLHSDGARIAGTGELLYVRDLEEGSRPVELSLHCAAGRSGGAIETAPYVLGDAAGG